MVKTEIETRTAEELIQVYTPLYPAAGSKNACKTVNKLSRLLRRVPNPEFVSKLNFDSVKVSRYLYDRADALICAALRWGGAECRFQALSARHELGILRDPKFVLPALNSNHYEDRLAAISCLAFLQSPETYEHLRPLCLQDENTSVRRSALWTYAFVNAFEWRKFAEAIGIDDATAEARTFAQAISVTESQNLWFL